MLRGNLKWSIKANEVIHIFKHLLSDHETFTVNTAGNVLEIDLSEVDKQTLRQEVFEWLERRIKC
jgi:hypothetical protein